MASIKGLSEEHCQALAGVQIGDLILVESYPKRVENEQSEADSEDESEGSQDDEDNSSSGGDEEEATANEQPSSDEQDDESEEHIEGSGSEEEAENVHGADEYTVAPTLYLVRSILQGDDGEIESLILRETTYCLKPNEATTSSYHIYGEEVAISASTTSSSTTIEGVPGYKIQEVIDDNGNTEYSIQLKPTGDDIRSIVFHGRCPAQCTNGWIETQEEMHALTTESIRLLLLPYAPTCPVCIGKPKMQQHQMLRELLEDHYQVDIGTLVDFYGELSIRRKALGYSFKQFDEREWGMDFGDMLSEDENETGPNGEYWEDYQEAQDPNANPTFQGASDAAIAALPQRSFSAFENGEESSTCLVCIMQLTDDAVVMELPCGHYFDVECAQKWLKTSNKCPSCRKQLPEIEMAASKGSNDEDEVTSTGSEESDTAELKSESDVKTDDIEMDGEDVVMSDVEDVAVIE